MLATQHKAFNNNHVSRRVKKELCPHFCEGLQCQHGVCRPIWCGGPGSSLSLFCYIKCFHSPQADGQSKMSNHSLLVGIPRAAGVGNGWIGVPKQPHNYHKTPHSRGAPLSNTHHRRKNCKHCTKHRGEKRVKWQIFCLKLQFAFWFLAERDCFKDYPNMYKLWWKWNLINYTWDVKLKRMPFVNSSACVTKTCLIRHFIYFLCISVAFILFL